MTDDTPQDEREYMADLKRSDTYTRLLQADTDKALTLVITSRDLFAARKQFTAMKGELQKDIDILHDFTATLTATSLYAIISAKGDTYRYLLDTIDRHVRDIRRQEERIILYKKTINALGDEAKNL